MSAPVERSGPGSNDPGFMRLLEDAQADAGSDQETSGAKAPDPFNLLSQR